MRSLTWGVALALVAVAAPVGGALDFCTGSLSQVIIIDTAGLTSRMYAVLDDPTFWLQKGFLFSVWVYEETNFIEGLQRNPDQGDPCGVPPPPYDTAVI